MAVNIYIQFTFGGTQIVGGPNTIQTIGGMNVSNHIEAFSLYHEVSAPMSVDGRATGSRREHQPITIVKAQDRASPLFLSALDRNDVVEATIRYFGINPANGETVLFQQQTLTGGRIASIRTEMLNNLYPDSANLPVLERVSISYATLITTNVVFGTESQISWSTPV